MEKWWRDLYHKPSNCILNLQYKNFKKRKKEFPWSLTTFLTLFFHIN